MSYIFLGKKFHEIFYLSSISKTSFTKDEDEVFSNNKHNLRRRTVRVLSNLRIFYNIINKGLISLSSFYPPFAPALAMFKGIPGIYSALFTNFQNDVLNRHLDAPYCLSRAVDSYNFLKITDRWNTQAPERSVRRLMLKGVTKSPMAKPGLRYSPDAITH